MISIVAFSSCAARKMLYQPTEISDRQLEEIRKAHPQAEEVWITTSGGKTLHGWVLLRDAEAPTIVYFGGNAERVWMNLDLFERLGVNAVLIEYRGYGRSTGSPKENALLADSLRVFDYVRDELQVPVEKMVAMGRSLGTGVAAYMAVERQVQHTILVTPFDSMVNAAAEFAPKWLVKMMLTDDYRTVNFIDRLEGEALVIIAEKDEITPPRLESSCSAGC